MGRKGIEGVEWSERGEEGEGRGRNWRSLEKGFRDRRGGQQLYDIERTIQVWVEKCPLD